MSKSSRPPVLILHSLPFSVDTAVFEESEMGVLTQVRAIEEDLDHLRQSHRTQAVRSLAEAVQALEAASEQIIFNLTEGFTGDTEGAQLIPAIARSLGKSCTGNDTAALLRTLDKWETNSILARSGLPVPPAIRVPFGSHCPTRIPFPGPYIVKPAASDASEGIDFDSVAPRPGTRLATAIRRVHTQIGQDALVEKLIGRLELNAALMEVEGKPRVLAIAEIDFSAFAANQPAIIDYAAKWQKNSFTYDHTPRVYPARIPRRLLREVEQIALRAWDIMGCRDYARVDFRLDEQLHPFILEVNANPDVSPDSGYSCSLRDAGFRHTDFVRFLLANARRRLPRAKPRPKSRPPATSATGNEGNPVVRRLEQADRDPIIALLEATRFFRPDEIEVAREVLENCLEKGPGGHYQSFIATIANRPVGWACIGPTPCTLGTFDVYWIAVDPSAQGQGVGRILMQAAEQLMRERGGRVSVVETSGRPQYASTRAFYHRLDYQEAAQLADFYAPGDDKVILLKKII
jgi:D-alanine-D-alanine ligase-like ATP-grasp enzyme/ribosomal protein S18 acetylase RimI-like enzyme